MSLEEAFCQRKVREESADKQKSLRHAASQVATHKAVPISKLGEAFDIMESGSLAVGYSYDYAQAKVGYNKPWGVVAAGSAPQGTDEDIVVQVTVIVPKKHQSAHLRSLVSNLNQEINIDLHEEEVKERRRLAISLTEDIRQREQYLEQLKVERTIS